MRLNEYTVPRHQQKVAVATTFDDESLSGETSSTASVHKGIKPQELNASFVVLKSEPDTLTAFYSIARSLDDNGDKTVYEITDDTANAINIHQVTFTGRIDCREMQNHQAWRVSFRLKEHLSVAEKTEQRQETAEADAPATEGEQVAAAPTVEEAENYTGFEAVLKVVDNALADDEIT